MSDYEGWHYDVIGDRYEIAPRVTLAVLFILGLLAFFIYLKDRGLF